MLQCNEFIKVITKKDTIFMNSKKVKTSDTNRLLFNLTGKINLKKSDKYLASSKTMNLKYLRHYSVSDIHHHFEYIIKNIERVNDNPVIRKHVNKIEHRIRFRIKSGHHLKHFTPKIKILVGS